MPADEKPAAVPMEIHRLRPRRIIPITIAKLLPLLVMFVAAALFISGTNDEFGSGLDLKVTLLLLGAISITILIPPLVLQFLAFNRQDWFALAIASGLLVGLDFSVLVRVGAAVPVVGLLVASVMWAQAVVCHQSLRLIEQLAARGFDAELKSSMGIGRFVAASKSASRSRGMAIAGVSLAMVVLMPFVSRLLTMASDSFVVDIAIVAWVLRILIGLAQLLGFALRRWKIAALTSGTLSAALVFDLALTIIVAVMLSSGRQEVALSPIALNTLLLGVVACFQLLAFRDALRLVANPATAPSSSTR